MVSLDSILPAVTTILGEKNPFTAFLRANIGLCMNAIRVKELELSRPIDEIDTDNLPGQYLIL
jgi:hypothetical protein